jgi:hypothetical protein
MAKMEASIPDFGRAADAAARAGAATVGGGAADSICVAEMPGELGMDTAGRGCGVCTTVACPVACDAAGDAAGIAPGSGVPTRVTPLSCCSAGVRAPTAGRGAGVG